ncbi:PDE10A [Branchiostoma lanceolatum]|uniref:Phosphodiesterase n=1 Tax=Branchiostoma lanceolatum TaxID=7740 RepID=A0A8J9ZFJ2_BRALA|nr:PDE10A [Branchiostoma lanceolatum]
MDPPKSPRLLPPLRIHNGRSSSPRQSSKKRASPVAVADGSARATLSTGRSRREDLRLGSETEGVRQCTAGSCGCEAVHPHCWLRHKSWVAEKSLSVGRKDTDVDFHFGLEPGREGWPGEKEGQAGGKRHESRFPKMGSSEGLSVDHVRQYLYDNPEFLDSFVPGTVPMETLDRWRLQRMKRQYRQQMNNDMSGSRRPNAGLLKRTSSLKIGRYTGPDKREHLHELTEQIGTHPNHLLLLYEMTLSIKIATNADGFNAYGIDDNGEEIFLIIPDALEPEESDEEVSAPSWPVCEGTTVAAYVAATSQPVKTTHVLGHDQYPEGLGANCAAASSILCLPLLRSNGTLAGIAELYRTIGSHTFSDEEEETANTILLWGGLALHNAEMVDMMMKQKQLNDFLLSVTRSIFQDIVSMDTVIMKIMNHAQKLVTADRASLFLVDSKTNELYARIFDVGSDVSLDEPEGEKVERKEISGGTSNTEEEFGRELTHVNKIDIRFPMDRGIGGHVATTGETLNIKDAYQDGRFNRDVDLQTGYHTKTILCMPIYNRGSVIGVVQMVNKLAGPFSTADEEAFEKFAVYCGLALHHAKLYDKIRRSEQKYKVALDVLSYHSTCSECEFQLLKQALDNAEQLPDVEEVELARFEYSPWSIPDDVKPLYVILMFKDLFCMSKFDMEQLIRFTMTVRKNYRPVPYHNWSHAFSVAHCAYTVIKISQDVFTGLECLALFVACLCHDLDHRGKSNMFMVKSSSPLAAVYSTSTMEHHHFNQTITILQHEGHNIFKHLSSEEYKQVLGYIKHAILATDLALYFGNSDRLREVVAKNEFSWENEDHREIVRAVTMTACDLSAIIKPWEIQQETVKVIFEEFYNQGDEERARGQEPAPMMDRRRAHELPANQVGFISGICLPCYRILAKVIPGCEAMVEGTLKNLEQWKSLANKQKAKEEREKLLSGETPEEPEVVPEPRKDPEPEKKEQTDRSRAPDRVLPRVASHSRARSSSLGDSLDATIEEGDEGGAD